MTDSPTRVDEIANGIFRISTAVGEEVMPGGFTFNQFLIRGDAPLLYHTGGRQMFPMVREAVASVLPVTSLRYIAFSHYESDECGALNDFLALANGAEPLCSAVAKMVSIDDMADRPARAMTDGEVLDLGGHRVQWLDTPHFPHAWECGHLFEQTTRTLFCGDLFTQPGDSHEPVTENDVLTPSEAMRAGMPGYFATPVDSEIIDKLANVEPTLLACMHGSSYRGDGAAMIRSLGNALG